MTTAKFKQPIVFQSRVIDLAAIADELDSNILKSCEKYGVFSDAHMLAAYELKTDSFQWDELVNLMEDKYGINLEYAKYDKLPRPLALDMCSGELHQIASIDYNRSGEVSSVIVRDGDALKYIYNAIPEHSWIPPEALKTELQIMYDGWQ